MKSLYSFLFLFLFLFAKQKLFSQVQSIRSVQRSLLNINDSFQYVDALNRIALLQYEQNIDSTLYYADTARGISKRLNYLKGIADATGNLGVVYDIIGNTPLALRYYNEAYNQYNSLSDTSNIVQTLMNIASVYSVAGNHEKAVTNYNQAFLMGSRLSNDSIMALVIYNYLLQYPDKFTRDSTSQFIAKATDIASRHHDTRLLLALEQVRANNEIQNGNLEKGIMLLLHMLDVCRQDQLFYTSLDILVQLGDIFHLSDSAQAVGYYKQALIITEQKNYGSYSKVVCQRLYDFYAGKKDIALAYFYSIKVLVAYQRQEMINRKSGIDYIEYALKDRQLESAQLKASYNGRMFWLATAVCILSAGLICLLLFNRKRFRKTHALLLQQFGELESTKEDLENSNHNYARLLKVVAHDLRNPIGAIHSVSSLMLDDESVNEENKALFQLMEQSTSSCLQMIGDLLETNFNIKEEKLFREAFSISNLLQQELQLINFKAKEKKQHLVLISSPDVTVNADRNKIMRVLDNLIVNAIKFSPRSGSIKVQFSQTNEGIVISVEDNGIGIPPEIAGKLFDPFSNVKRQGTNGEQSFGLGLYICKQIIEAHGGRIWFESEPGRGSIFSLLLNKENELSGSKI